MKSIFNQIKQWIIKYQSDIILVIGVVLISLLSFAAGYIVAKIQEKEPIKIEKSTNNEFFISPPTNLFKEPGITTFSETKSASPLERGITTDFAEIGGGRVYE